MTIEIHNPELESLLNQRLKTGHFANLEEMLLDTFRTSPVATDVDLGARAMDAAERIRQLRKGISLDRPKGMSLREYAHIGHRY